MIEFTLFVCAPIIRPSHQRIMVIDGTNLVYAQAPEAGRSGGESDVRSSGPSPNIVLHGRQKGDRLLIFCVLPSVSQDLGRVMSCQEYGVQGADGVCGVVLQG